MYKSNYPTYLIHFNKNHDPKNGQFAEGDGDGDGIANDHEHKKKKNRYQYTDGTLTPKGKQRWANQYIKDIRRAKRKGLDTTNVQTPIESDKWARKDTATTILKAAWFLQVANYGGVWFNKSSRKFSEESIDNLLKTHSGDSVYSKGKNFVDHKSNIITSYKQIPPIWGVNPSPETTKKAFDIFVKNIKEILIFQIQKI